MEIGNARKGSIAIVKCPPPVRAKYALGVYLSDRYQVETTLDLLSSPIEQYYPIWVGKQAIEMSKRSRAPTRSVRQKDVL